MKKLTETAPDRIYMVVSSHKEHECCQFPTDYCVPWAIESFNDERAEVAYVRADLLEVELKRVAACKNLIASMEKTASWLKNANLELETKLKLRGDEEVSKQRDANEALTNELEQQAKRISELEAERTWQPIETAPKDGTNVLLITRKGNMATGLWQGSGPSEGWWLRGSAEPNCFFNGHYGPTHWMQLPQAPKE
jgi:hypothetical protein